MDRIHEKGLSALEAERRLGQYGLNELPEKPPPNNLSLIISQLSSPLVYILLVAGLVTFFLHEVTDTIVIGIAVFINTVLGFFQEKKAGQALQALKNLIHPETKVIRDGKLQLVPVANVVPGDLVVLHKGDKLPADGKLSFSNRLFVAEAMLTGESVPISKGVDANVYMGTVVTAGQARYIVEKTGSNTELGKIAKSIDVTKEDTPLKKQLVIFSKKLSVLTLALTVIIFVVGITLGSSPKEIFITAVALAVSAIPEGLLVGLTVVLAIGMQRILANKGLVRNLVSAETLGGVTTICVDKTGTLTEGKMKVIDVIGDEKALKRQVVVANDLDDPIVIAAYEWGSDRSNTPVPKKYERLDSIPFSSENNFFACLTKFDDRNNMMFVNGAPEVLIERSTLTESEKKTLYNELDELTGKGKRVLGLACKPLPTKVIEINGTEAIIDLEWQGLIAFSDPVRLDVKDALKITKKAGIRLVVITGDYAKTAVAVLNHIGITPSDSDIILGDELENMPDIELERRLFVDRNIKLFARTKPEQKMNIIQALKAKDEVVAMMGDGVNDAPALTAADIGVVVGEATDVAKEAADLVLLDSSFKTIVLAVEEGRGIFDNLRKMILYLMSDAFIEIFIVFVSLLVGLPLPITAAQILWVNVVSDGFPNLALTIDPKGAGIMDRAPRSTSTQLVSAWMKDLIILVSLIGGTAAFLFYWYVYKTSGDIVLARSVTFATVGMNSLIYVFSVKALKDHFWKVNIFNNKWLIVAVVGGMLMQVLPFSFAGLRHIFDIVPIGGYWFGVFGAAFLLFFVIEISKYVFTSSLKANKNI